jgi:glycosyltransferase involved in cell wall biosynthesis
MVAGQRVIIVVNDAAFFLSHRLPIALGARAAGYEVHVATPVDAASPGIERQGLRFHPIPLSRSGMAPDRELRAIGALVALYRELRPDLVHHVTAKPILYGGIAARIARVPAVVHAVTGLGYMFISEAARAKLLRQLVRLAYRAVTSHGNCAMIFQNEDDRRLFAGAIMTDQVAMIRGSGVDLARFRAQPLPRGEPPIVVLPSRMLWDKGVGELAAAARELKRRGVAVRVALVGGIDPSNPAAIPRSTIESWVKEGIVEWWGQRDNMAEVFAQATIACLPSYREGMPKALLEACATGRPIVTTDVPGCRDVLTGGDHGVLVPARDSIALANALASLLGDRPRLERMAGRAAAHATRFSVESVVAQTLALYGQLLAN